MPSFQARIARIIVRLAIRGPLAKHRRTLDEHVATLRRTLEIGDKRNARVAADMRIVPSEGPAPGEWVSRKDVAFGNKAVLYMHGGGMVAGSTRGYRGMITLPLARKLGVPVFSLDYRRAPEHRFPAALDDAVAAYEQMRERVPAEGIIFAGDSAGGNLAFATLLRLREKYKTARPCAGVIGMSPWTDLAGTGASIHENAASDDMFPPTEGDIYVGLAYTEAERFTEPLVSPLYGDYAGAPPALVFASTIEMLRDDSTRLADKLRSQGVDVTLVLEPGMPHVWPIFPALPEAARALDVMQKFAEKAWSRAPGSVLIESGR